MKFNIPKHCEIRWQAALAVLEDLQEDESAPFNMRQLADDETLWEKTNGCGTAACFAGYISVSPYCRALGYPVGDDGLYADHWLLGDEDNDEILFEEIFASNLDKGSRVKTLRYLKRTLKTIFKESTGKKLVAPLTFYY